MFRVNKKIIDVVLVFSLLTLNVFTPFSSVSIVYFEQVNVCRQLISFCNNRG